MPVYQWYYWSQWNIDNNNSGCNIYIICHLDINHFSILNGSNVIDHNFAYVNNVEYIK